MAVLADFIDMKASCYRYKPYDRVFVPLGLSDKLAEFRIFAIRVFENVDFAKLVFPEFAKLNFRREQDSENGIFGKSVSQNRDELGRARQVNREGRTTHA